MLVLCVLAVLCSLANSHTVTLCYDVVTKPGSLIIWQEHWHGDYDASSFPGVPYGILFNNPSVPIDFSKWYLKPHNWRNNVPITQLQNENKNLVCNMCDSTRYHDWFSYEFPICIFGVKGLSLSVTGDHRVVVTEPSNYNTCPTKIQIPPSGCPDINGDGYCDTCNCVSCSGTPYDSVCGNKAWNKGEECDDASDTNCKNCKCNPGYMSTTPATAVCQIADPCKTFGYNGQTANTLSCTNSGINRIIVCAAGYYVKGTSWLVGVTLAPTAIFSGCIDMDECAAYGYSGRTAFTKSCTTPSLNTRDVECNTGYVVSGTTSPVISLAGSTAFPGCSDLDECVVYGSSGKPANVASCTTTAGVNTRTLTCNPGFEVVGTSLQTSITLNGAAAFTGCKEIDECAVYKYSGKDAFTDSCIDGINKRTISCLPGYNIIGRSLDTRTSDYIGNSAFPGCVLTDYCVLYAYSGKPANAKGCVSGINQRTITCNPGYFATSPNLPTVTLIGATAFAGCGDILECSIYAYSGASGNTASCTESGANTRTITCQAGYYVSGTNPATAVVTSVTLTGSETFPGCTELNECVIYGYSGKAANTQSCTDGVNKRTILCANGYYINGREHSVVTADFIGSAPFGGCVIQDYCTLYGFSGKPLNTESCVSGLLERTLTCLPGYYVTPPSTRSIKLSGPEAVFTGCFEIDECTLYGNSGLSAFVESCTDGTNKRTMTCLPGYFVIGKTSADRKVELIGSAAFTGCQEIDECKDYGYSGNSTNTKSCTDGINKRTITCADGYYIKGRTMDISSQDYAGAAVFPGCALADYCMLYGLDGNSGNTVGCVPGVNTRVITCLPGFYAVSPAEPKITLTGNAIFAGCFPIDECKVYAFSGKGTNADACYDGPNKRTVICKDGYYISGKTEADTQVELVGNAAFPGCVEIDECKLYGYSGATANTKSCEDKVNGRLITCVAGWKVGTGHVAEGWVLLEGDDKFAGCYDINECDYYGFNTLVNNTVSCENLVNSRKLTCLPGFYAVAPATPVIVLTGNATFKGCTEINECEVYGTNNKPTGYINCQDGVNTRTITCADGYYSTAPINPRVTLIGSEVFAGCIDLDECMVYGASGNTANVLTCVQPFVNARTVICERGYSVFHRDGSRNANTTLLASAAFPGCVPWCGDSIRLPVEGCDDGNAVAGDGCAADCTVEEGYDCGDWENQGYRCCHGLPVSITDYGLDQTLICRDSWWVSPTNSPIVFDQDTPIIIDGELNLCGKIILGDETGANGDLSEVELRDRVATWVIATHAVVAGSVEILGTGALWFRGDNDLHIYRNCNESITVNDVQLSVVDTGMIAVEDIYWTYTEEDGAELDDTPSPYIVVEDCSRIEEGGFFIGANNIPVGSNVFPLIQGTCTSTTNPEEDGTFMTLDHVIPGHCSNFGTESDENTVWVRTNHKDLCAGEMAAMGVVVIGLGAGAAAATAVGAGGVGAVAGGAGDAYIAL